MAQLPTWWDLEKGDGDMSIWLNGASLPVDRFPNGERRWSLTQDWWDRTVRPKTVSVLSWQWEDDRDWMDLIMVAGWLRRVQYSVDSLEIAYLPYSRMDRAPLGAVFSLTSVAEILRDFPAKRVAIVDPHSDVALGMIPKALAFYPIVSFWGSLQKAIAFPHMEQYTTALVFPDAGAEKRYATLFEDEQVLVGVKHRDPTDGKISYRGFLGDTPQGPWQAVIVDDLCSYGNTFLQSAKALREAGAEMVYLYITHAESAMWQGDVLTSPLINRVFTTDTMVAPAHEQTDKCYVWSYWHQRLETLAHISGTTKGADR